MKTALLILLSALTASAQGTYMRRAPYAVGMVNRPMSCITGDTYTYTVSGLIDNCGPDNVWVPALPTGLIALSITACPSGWVEVAALNGFTVIGTLAANGDVGTAGGSDSVTPEGTNAGNTTTGNAANTARALADPAGNILARGTNPAIPIPAQVFTGTAFDNRSKFLKVIFCSKN